MQTLLAVLLCCSDLILPFLEVAELAADDRVCKLIAWNNTERQKLKSAYSEFREKLQVKQAELQGTFTGQVIYQQYMTDLLADFQKTHSLLLTTNQLPFAARGMFVRDSFLSVLSDTVGRYCHINANTNTAIKNELKLITKEIDNEIQLVVASRQFNKDVLEKESKRLLTSALQKIKQMLDRTLNEKQLKAVSELESEFANHKLEHNNAMLRSYIYQSFIQQAHVQGKFISKTPLRLRNSILQISSLPHIQNVCIMSEIDKSVIRELHAKLISDFNDTAVLYQNALPNDSRKTMREANGLFQSTIDAQIKKYDNALKQQLADSVYARLLEITYQLKGTQYVLDQDILAVRYNLTEEQKEKVRTIRDSVTKAQVDDVPTKGKDQAEKSSHFRTKVARSRYLTSQGIFHGVFSPEQQSMWLKRTGNQLSEADVIKLLIQLFEENEKSRK